MSGVNSDQASKLRQIANAVSGKGAVCISVSSGKGGVGKTTFAINLACTLAAAGKKILLFDADLGLANIDIMLRISPSANIRRYFDGSVTLEDVLIKNVHGFDLFPASSGVLELAELSDENFEKVKKVLALLHSKYDYIIFDTGSGISGNVHRFVSLADHVVVITVPEPTAISDAYALLKTAKQQYTVKKAHLVFNRVDDTARAQKIFDNLRDVVMKFLQIELHLLGFLKEDNNIKKAARGSKPLSIIDSKSIFSDGVRRIVEKIQKEF